MAGFVSSSQDNTRQTIVDRLLDAVKQCQIRFGGKTELATDKDSRISCLCVQWETALQYGMKSIKKINPIKHVTDQVLLKSEGQSNFWQFVKEHLSATEIRRFNLLQNIETDVGRARAWLRSALNEESLERYLHSFLGNKNILSTYYGQDALLMDDERSSMLPMMAAGLNSILFAINIDDAELNISAKQASTNSVTVQSAPAPVVNNWQGPSPMYAMYGAPGKEKKRRKKKRANIAQIENVDFEDDENIEQPITTKDENEASSNITPANKNTSLTSINQERETYESSRDEAHSKSHYSAIEIRGVGDDSQNVSRVKVNASLLLLDKNSENKENLDSLLTAKTTGNNEKQFEHLRQRNRSEPVTVAKNEQVLSNDIQGSINSAEKSTVTPKRLSISWKNSAQRIGHGTSENFTDEIIENEPLVDLASGVSLTPVSCPDESTIWGLEYDGSSESLGIESATENPLTSRLLVDSFRDSPASSVCTDDDVSEDASLAIGATEAAISATRGVQKEMADFTRSTLVRTMGDGRMSPPNVSSTGKEMTSDELKQAIVSMMLRKDEVEECNRSLRQLLDKEMQESSSLRVQVDDLKRDLSSSKEIHHSTVHALTSENDLLKHQLKKYVAAVQSLRRNESLDTAGASEVTNSFPGLSLSDEPLDPLSDEQAADFEKKLIQVADMHGELIELNERLQKMLNIREHQLRRLREELVNLRGPLPNDGCHDDTVSLDDFGPRLVSVNTRPLINIWIPSAFAQGKASNIHHTYQVYVRIKDDEWNVYRRYSDFYGLHKKISKQYPAISQFKFPQKRVIGNRDAKFVEIRRRHLQSYLRKVINYSLTVIPELSEDPSKPTLLKCFSFFGQTPKEAATQASGSNTSTYTGL